MKQIARQATPPFNERAYGFASLADLLRAAHKAGAFRVERDRQGVIRVFSISGGHGRTGPLQQGSESSQPVVGEGKAPAAGSTAAAHGHVESEDDDNIGNRAERVPEFDSELDDDPPQPASNSSGAPVAGKRRAPRRRAGVNRGPRKRAAKQH